ncbi:MAG: phycobiliprotein lyase, partial [Cyanobacteria bacterium P01_H01_bin.15]
HHLAFGHFEAIESDIEIAALETQDPTVVELCKLHGIEPQLAVSPFRMSWEGQSDWDEEQVLAGKSVLVPIPDTEHSRSGQLLRDQGYAEEMAAVGRYILTEDGTFILTTGYDRAAAEEKIWFATPNLRCRVSLIKTSKGTGVVTASFSSEIRQNISA